MTPVFLLAHLAQSRELAHFLLTEPTVGSIWGGMAIAFGFGAFHALSPGHGKALVSAYLIGTQGTPQQAILLGVTTTITHTLGVFLLGAIALFASQYILPEQLYPVLSALSGMMICLVGVSLVRKRLQSPSHDHHSDHEHDHHHHHHHHHHHASNKLSDLIKLGIAGGLVPCPSALVMLLGAIALHQITYGLFLVTGFSLGLALVLVLLGLIAVYARQWLEKFPRTQAISRSLSLTSACVVVVIGLGLTFVSSTSLL
ncbi:sulfite exporter TauE/SafE family protein [Spirulina subsalsa FACHB-351]|uniref:Sulfite exporter TauE/SafE family protein n=1 Tax=Spirulina subsalsa FACHB-351 TaxID=234711 RepID=A0ABT3LBJ5_9CYAN|nr:sulfite exporter TauE/SafE family protein [Spirulina subsalsa]MCW6038887.1 sulfite exporter TauE/SafE family protein [Spirulina subsalsa FACHB-351]